MVRALEFVWLDVFAERPLEGNPLAVFPDARGLDEGSMQAIARETGLSETTFVLPEDDARDREEGFRTRIFTVDGELPFAGHPTLGTAAVLARLRSLNRLKLRLPVGPIPVSFTERDGRPFGTMVQNDPTVGQTHDPEAVARALGLPTDEIDRSAPVQTISTGVPFAIVPLKRLAILAGLRPDLAPVERYVAGTDARFLYLVCRETGDRAVALRARMFFYGGEDPATGSAAGPAAAWAVLHGWASPGEALRLEQGVEMHRRSVLHAQVDLRGERVVNVRVGGSCADVIRGELRLP
jgi:trans-2,3-dihydro-3-hydroxyanthranilate isomerase